MGGWHEKGWALGLHSQPECEFEIADGDIILFGVGNLLPLLNV